MNESAVMPITEDDAKLVVAGNTGTGMNDWLKMALESSKFVTEVPGGVAYFSVGKDQQGDPCLSVWLSTFMIDQHVMVYKGQDGEPVTYVRTKTAIDKDGKLAGDTVGRYIGRAVKAHVGFRPTEAKGNRKGKPQSHMFTWLKLGEAGTYVWEKFQAQDFSRINHQFYGVTPETDEEREERIAKYRAAREQGAQTSEQVPAQAPAAEAPAQEAPHPAESTEQAVDAFQWK